MRPALARQLTRYPATFVATLAPFRRPRADTDAWRPAATFAAVSAAVGYLLSALAADDAIYRHYEWHPALAPVLTPLTALPGFAFLYNGAVAAGGLVVAAATGYLLLRLSGASGAVPAFTARLLYFAGGPLAVVTLVQAIGLPVTFGTLFTLPEGVRLVVPAAIAIYLLGWLLLRLAFLPEPSWQSVAAAITVAAAFSLVPPDRRAMLRLEPYAMGLDPYGMTTDSMAPQIEAGSITLANRRVYGWRAPASGELVVFFKTVGGIDVAVLRRVVGVAGDTVAVRGGRLAVNGAEVAREQLEAAATGAVVRETLPSGATYEVIELDAGGPNDEVEAATVPTGHVYVLADHRDTAIDSRQFGPVAVQELKGLVYYRLTPAPGPLR